MKRHQKHANHTPQSQTGTLLFKQHGTNPPNQMQQYRSPPRIEAMVTEPPSNDKSAQQSCFKPASPKVLYSYQQIQDSVSSVNILKKLTEATNLVRTTSLGFIGGPSALGSGTTSHASKAKDRYINKAKEG